MNKTKKQTIKVDILDIISKESPIVALKIQTGFSIEANHVACNLRESDYKEILRSCGRCPREMVNRSWRLPGLRWIIFSNKEPVALFGVVDCDNKTGTPWMVTTDKFHDKEVEKYFIKHCKRHVELFFELGGYELLYNCVDVENEMAINWLQWCGFTMDEIVEHGPQNKPFWKFSMYRSVH